ncbi:MAG: alpha/beta hydrolase-fold protein [Myxococcota bacterium]
MRNAMHVTTAVAFVAGLSGCDGEVNGGGDSEPLVEAGPRDAVVDRAADSTTDAPMDAPVEALDAGDAEVMAPIPSTGFCECAKANPAPAAGSFEMCATMRGDGVGTYYEGPPYSRTADAQTQAGVPEGTVTMYRWDDSTIYPGTRRAYWIYVPAQYDENQPAALFVLTDGGVYIRNGDGAPYRTPTVLDNLIAEGAMPVTIAVFIDPGEFDNGNRNRSEEYDRPDDQYARFLHTEILPEVEGMYSISQDPAMRAIGGRSSGAVAAWGVAWNRPDSFGLVYSTIGSFVQLRQNDDGNYAEMYPVWAEAEDRKPIRVTLLSGTNDLMNQFGSWPDAHMAMTTALDCAGYTYRSGYGEGRHGDGTSVNHSFGADLRWLFAEAR